MKKPIVLVLIFICAYSLIFSQSSVQMLDPASIEYGEAGNQLGSLGPGNDSMRSLFFSVLRDGTLAIPDYYNERIAIFSVKGEFLRGIPAAGLVSPRMNYFGTSKNGQYVLFNDSVLYALQDSGEVLWNVPFPMGVFPSSIFSGSDFVSLSVGAGSAEQTFRLGFAKPFGVIEAPFCFTWSAESKSLGGTVKGDTPDAAAILLYRDGATVSWWWHAQNGVIKVWKVSGLTGESWSIPVTDPVESAWTWLDINTDKSGTVLYVLGDGKNKMVINRYSLVRK